MKNKFQKEIVSMRKALLVFVVMSSVLSAIAFLPDGYNFTSVYADNNAPDADSKPRAACQSQSVPYANAVFNNVERVVIAVDVKPNAVTTFEQQNALLPSLRKENLENMLVGLYTERFKSFSNGKSETPTPGCYGRNDQPILVFDTSDME